uniref:Mutator-like transposase domain-containing protein n=1 Tax=Amphimedon queenslandica TaxID=400682 RepID=A0A1X7U6I6_AMPQE
MSGVAVIFGHYTKKLLFLGVRNKFCSICAIHNNKKAVSTAPVTGCSLQC